MATLRPITGGNITVTAVTAVTGGSDLVTFSGSGFNALAPITSVLIDSDTQLRIPLGCIASFA